MPGTLGVAFTTSLIPQWVFDPDTLRIIAVNDAAVACYGYTRHALLTMKVFQLHPAEEGDAVRHLAAAAPPALDSHLWRHATRDGERSVRMVVSPVTIAGRSVRLVQVVDVPGEFRLSGGRDAARNRDHDAEVSRLHETLATVGHEMRQPLASLVSAVAVMEQRAGRDIGVRAREVVKRQVGLMTRLVDDLLDVARVQQGKVTLRREVVDLRKLIEEAVAAHFAEIAARGLTLDTRLPGSAIWVDVDPARMHQVLANLFSNALRNSHEGGRLWLRVERQEDQARLIVGDDGNGIAGSMLPHLFERFVQAEPGANGGLGIGLWVVRALVELHGGKVSGSSRGAGRGAEFIVSLPVSSAPVSDAHAFASDLRFVAELIRTPSATGGEAMDGAWNGIRTALLLADDDGHLLRASSPALALTGYSEHELRTLRVFDIIAMEAPGVEQHWQEFVATGRQEGIVVLRRKDGVQVPVRYCALTDVRPGLHVSALEAL